MNKRSTVLIEFSSRLQQYMPQRRFAEHFFTNNNGSQQIYRIYPEEKP
jgi:hypothetical protein